VRSWWVRWHGDHTVFVGECENSGAASRWLRPWSGQHRLAIRRLIHGGAPAQRTSARLEQRLKELPAEPGFTCCAMAERIAILYNRKSRVCRSRVRSYFPRLPTSLSLASADVRQICEIEFIVTDSEGRGAALDLT